MVRQQEDILAPLAQRRQEQHIEGEPIEQVAFEAACRGQGHEIGIGRAEEETKLMQELYQGLTRMEERVEALETLLLDRERKESGR